jgi:hypothetical protein
MAAQTAHRSIVVQGSFDRAQPTRSPTKKNRVKQLSLAAFLTTKGLFLFHTHHVVSGHRPDCAKPIPLRVYGLPRQTWLFLATCKVSGQMLCLIGKEISGRFLHGATTYRCRYEEVVHANSLPETARLKVEGRYVIPHLCVEQPQLVSI